MDDFAVTDLLAFLGLCPNLHTFRIGATAPCTSLKSIALGLLGLKREQKHLFDNLREINLQEPAPEILRFLKRCPSLQSVHFKVSTVLVNWKLSDCSVQIRQVRSLTLRMDTTLPLPPFLDIITGYFPNLASLSILDGSMRDAPDRAQRLWVRKRKGIDQCQTSTDNGSSGSMLFRMP
jgi:hypothetical protein